jgi:hypothetical protein
MVGRHRSHSPVNRSVPQISWALGPVSHAWPEGRPCSCSRLALARQHRRAVRKHALTIENENTSSRRQLVRRPVGTPCCLAGVRADSIYYIVYTWVPSWAPSLMGPWASHRLPPHRTGLPVNNARSRVLDIQPQTQYPSHI